jgi:hypothetical protein
MPSRNSEVLREILKTLEIEEPHALARLENHFKSLLLVVAGNETDVARHAEQLRLAIIENEEVPDSNSSRQTPGTEALNSAAPVTFDPWLAKFRLLLRSSTVDPQFHHAL